MWTSCRRGKAYVRKVVRVNGFGAIACKRERAVISSGGEGGTALTVFRNVATMGAWSEIVCALLAEFATSEESTPVGSPLYETCGFE